MTRRGRAPRSSAHESRIHVARSERLERFIRMEFPVGSRFAPFLFRVPKVRGGFGGF